MRPTSRSAVLLTALLLALWLPMAARAHCDSLDGPVVVQAREALTNQDVTAVLKWVTPANETEIRAAFARTLAVRQHSEAARELADLWFFETLVRLHRAGEGAPYTGLKPAGSTTDPSVLAADRALASGSVDALAKRLGEHAAASVESRFKEALEASRHADASVAAGRDYVKAYVTYVHHVENLHRAIVGAVDHHAEAPTGEAGHAEH